MAGDDFRLVVEFDEAQHGLHFGRALGERQFAKDIRDQLQDGVLVTRDGPHVFLYTASRENAEAAEKVVREVLAEHDFEANVSPVLRWHPVEERWEDASVPLPKTEEALASEHERQERQEAEETQTLGYAEWEVRVDFPTHRDAVAFAKRLEAEGITPITRRWKYVLIGTSTDDEAKVLAERLGAEVPPGATVTAEPSATLGWEMESRNPFSLLGGLGR
jgi:hypothetical protein